MLNIRPWCTEFNDPDIINDQIYSSLHVLSVRGPSGVIPHHYIEKIKKINLLGTLLATNEKHGAMTPNAFSIIPRPYHV